MAEIVAKAKSGTTNSVKLHPIGVVGDDGYSTSRDGYRLIESRSKEPVFADLIFSEFFSLSPGKRFALLIQDRRGRDPIYDLNALDLQSGNLFRLHTMGRGQRSLVTVHWKNDFEVEYEANILNGEFGGEVSEFPTVSYGTVQLRFEQVGEDLKPTMNFNGG